MGGDMKKQNNPAETDRKITAGGGFVIATLIGGIGLIAGILLWRAGAHPLVAIAVYLATPAIMISAITLRQICRPTRKQDTSGKPETIANPSKQESGQV